MIVRATIQDIEGITNIYNEAILDKNASADTKPVSVQSREWWFHAHKPNRPIYVLKDDRGEISAWCALGDYYPREAYHITAEVSIYVRKSARGKGVGKKILAYVLDIAPNFGIKNVIAVIFADNEASWGLFKNFGFNEWGKLPKVCDLGGDTKDVSILGKNLNAAKI